MCVVLTVELWGVGENSPTRCAKRRHLPRRLRRHAPARRRAHPPAAVLHGRPVAVGAEHLVLPRLGRLAVEVPAAREQGEAAVPDDVVLVCVPQHRVGESSLLPLPCYTPRVTVAFLYVERGKRRKKIKRSKKDGGADEEDPCIGDGYGSARRCV